MTDNEFFNRYYDIIRAVERQERNARRAGLITDADVYVQAILDLRKSYSLRIFKRAISSTVSRYLGTVIGLLIFLFIACGFAEYIVIKLIGG